MGALPESDLDIQPGDFSAARMLLARLHAGNGVRARQLWVELAQTAARALNVERIGAWILVDEGRALRCRYLLQYSNRQVYQGAMLRAQDFPAYFQALHEQRIVSADDALDSELTCSLQACYLQPLGITSLLDAPIYVGGRVVGVACHEHIGPPRQWTAEECSFAATVADTIARLHGEYEHHQARNALAGYQQQLMELHRLEALGRMAAGIAHDFRGILAVAQGFTEMLQRTPDLPEQATQYSQRILSSLQRGQDLAQQIVDFGRSEPVAPRVLNLQQALNRCAPMLRMVIGSHVDLEIEGADTVSQVFMDAAQLERILMNLAINARDAMGGGGQLTIELRETTMESEHDSPTYVRISVRDTGHGMDPVTCQNACKPFFTTKGERGTGLGLVIVEQIMARAGGRMSLDSEPGQGTTVHLYLPRIAAAALARAS